MSLDRSQPPRPGPVRPFEFPAVNRTALPNGVVLLHAGKDDFPLVTVRAVLDAGAAVEHEGEEGLAWLTAHALEGGTVGRSGEDLAWELELLGAQLETFTTWDSTHVALTARSDRLHDALALLAAIVRSPAFPDREVERLRNEQIAEIMRRATDPRSLADDAINRFIYDDDATWGRPVLGLQQRIAVFERAHAVAFHERCFTPHSSAVVVVGAVDADTAGSAVAAAFGDWSGAPAPAPAPRHGPRNDSTTLYIVDRPSAVQSELRIGHPGVQRDHPDYYALQLMNTTLGGAFTSRLNLNLREKHGFTYGVRSGFAFRRAPGPFVIQTAVASDVTARAIEETMREIDLIIEDGVTADELRSARDFLAGTLPLGMQTTESLAARIADLHTYSLPPDWFERFRSNLEAVSRDDVRRVAREHLHPRRATIVVVGSAAAVEPDLRNLGIGPVIDGSAQLQPGLS